MRLEQGGAKRALDQVAAPGAGADDDRDQRLLRPPGEPAFAAGEQVVDVEVEIPAPLVVVRVEQVPGVFRHDMPARADLRIGGAETIDGAVRDVAKLLRGRHAGSLQAPRQSPHELCLVAELAGQQQGGLECPAKMPDHSGGRIGGVPHLRPWAVGEAIVARPEPQRQIDVLAVHEEALVEPADRLEGGSSGQHAAPRAPHRLQRRRIVEFRVLHRLLTRLDQRDPGGRLDGRIDELADGVRTPHDVGIGNEEQVASGAFQIAIVAGPVTPVGPLPDIDRTETSAVRAGQPFEQAILLGILGMLHHQQANAGERKALRDQRPEHRLQIG